MYYFLRWVIYMLSKKPDYCSVDVMFKIVNPNPDHNHNRKVDPLPIANDGSLAKLSDVAPATQAAYTYRLARGQDEVSDAVASS